MNDYSHHISKLREGSVWIDETFRTLVVWRVHWGNAVRVEAYSLLVIHEGLKVVKRAASEIEFYVREGRMQYCNDLLP